MAEAIAASRPLRPRVSRYNTGVAERIEVWVVDLDAVVGNRPPPGARRDAARVALRDLLAARAGAAPEELSFVAGAHGKPALAGPHAGLPFSLSHSGGLALVALGEARPVGVDLERPRPPERAAGVAERFFTAAEARAVRGRPGDFLRIWTRKEALLKAVGTGLTVPLDSFEAPLGSPARIASFHGSAWTLLDVAVPAPYVAAVASGAADPWVEVRRWAPELTPR
jgi:4'-phosphopantetheinyl transferase